MYRMGEEEIQAVTEVIASKKLWRYQEGSRSQQFERDLAAKVGALHSLVLTSGTAGLVSGLAALGIGPGDEVLVPAYTFIATPFAAMALGAIPVLVEVDESLTLDVADLKRKITPRSKAVIPVHINGLPCAMDEILTVARNNGLAVLEDACQAMGGSYRGQRLGTLGQAGVYSFNYYKILSCGEGGALVTNDAELYEKALIYHDAGCSFFSPAQKVKTPYFAGSNYRMSEILSAVLGVQLTRLDGLLADLRERKAHILGHPGLPRDWVPAPVHDALGDCATKSGFIVKDHESARRIVELVNGAHFCVQAECPLDTSRHVYTNWEAVREGRSPLKGLETRRYAADACPQTLEFLGRTVYLTVHPDTPMEELDQALAQFPRLLA